MRVICKQRLARASHRAVDNPVVAALLAWKMDCPDCRNVAFHNRGRDIGNIESLGQYQRNLGLQRKKARVRGKSQLFHVERSLHLGEQLPGHQQSGRPRRHVFRSPQTRVKARDAKFRRPLTTQRSNLKIFLEGYRKARVKIAKISLIYCDTGVENIVLDSYVKDLFREMKNEFGKLELPIKIDVLRAPVQNRFFVRIVGRGYRRQPTISGGAQKHSELNL